MDMKIAPPIGYASVSPLQKTQRVALPVEGAVPAFAQSMHALPISFSEILPASRDYPLAFVSADNGDKFAIMAILGLQKGQNLFRMEDGRWDRRAYLPAYIRRYPFCMATVTRDGKLQKDRIFCVEDSALSPEGETLFDNDGNALPAWSHIENFLLEFERDLLRAEEFCQLVKDLELLEPVSVTAEVAEGFKLQLEGIHRVRRESLARLPEDALRQLFEKQTAEGVFAHLFSLGNFKRLLNRRSIFSAPQPSAPGKLN
ncbi:MAG: SapC family protein [Burkholderiales bacterium]